MIKSVNKNLRRLRALRGLDQGELAAAAGISRNAYRAMETGASEPRVGNLQRIAEALGVPMVELFREVPQLKTLRFRSLKTRSAQQEAERDEIVTRVALWLKDFTELEDELGSKSPLKIQGLIGKESDPVLMARRIREKLGLAPDAPVTDICDELEEAGIKLMLTPSKSEVFFGLSVGLDDDGPAVAINTRADIPVERRIFSTAHELGHLLLHPSSYDGEMAEESEKAPEEQQANVFASHFLMPQEAFTAKWNEYAGLHFVDRVMKMKRHFLVSYKTVLRRLIELGVVDKEIWRVFGRFYQSRFDKPLKGSKDEPFPLAEPDFREDRLDLLVRQAWEKRLISLDRAAEILGLSLEDMRERMESWAAVR